MNIIERNREIIIGAIVALIVGLLIGFGVGRQTAGGGEGVMMAAKAAATSTATTSAGSQLLGQNQAISNPTVVAEEDSVSVADQPAGMSVIVSSATFSQEGWIAIRDSSGTTLGAALFSPGTHTNVSVPLLRPTQAGQNYQALIYFDDGTKTLNLKTETIVLNMDGSVAGATFNAH